MSKIIHNYSNSDDDSKPPIIKAIGSLLIILPVGEGFRNKLSFFRWRCNLNACVLTYDIHMIYSVKTQPYDIMKYMHYMKSGYGSYFQYYNELTD